MALHLCRQCRPVGGLELLFDRLQLGFCGIRF
jgi:hypothetical protein